MACISFSAGCFSFAIATETLDDRVRAFVRIQDGCSFFCTYCIIPAARGAERSLAPATVLLEAANFEPVGIMKSSERLGLRTEGSNRWEKGVDPHLAGQAVGLVEHDLDQHRAVVSLRGRVHDQLEGGARQQRAQLQLGQRLGAFLARRHRGARRPEGCR